MRWYRRWKARRRAARWYAAMIYPYLIRACRLGDDIYFPFCARWRKDRRRYEEFRDVLDTFYISRFLNCKAELEGWPKRWKKICLNRLLKDKVTAVPRVLDYTCRNCGWNRYSETKAHRPT